MGVNRWALGGGNCGGEVDCLPCTPCCIPEHDLTVTEHYPLYGVSGTATLHYNAVFSRWSGAGGPDGGDPFPFTYALICNLGAVALQVADSSFGPVPSSLTSYTCSPFHLEYSVPGYGTIYIDG